MSPTANTLKSEDLTIEELFKDFFIVPDYQREYVWETENVEQLLNDVRVDWSPERPAQTEYFLGSIVVCKRTGDIYELIDGQQRMTTCFLVLCALRDCFAQLGVKVPALESQIATVHLDDLGNERRRARIAVQYEDCAEILTLIADQRTDELARRGTSTSWKRIVEAHRTIIHFLVNEIGKNERDLRAFWAHFIKRTKLVRVSTGSVSHALRIFETINDRGVDLDSMDLLKNLMFLNVAPDELTGIKTRWKRVVDTLRSAKEKPQRFLRYFIASEFTFKPIREDESYSWIVSAEGKRVTNYHKDPIGFVDRMSRAAEAYHNFLSGKDAQGKPSRYLDNIRYMSGSAKQHLVLLLAARSLPSDAFDLLARQVENLFFASVVTRESTKEFEPKFAKWAKTITRAANVADVQRFIDEHVTVEKTNLAVRFHLAFTELNTDSIPPYRLRYILAKLAQHANESAYGSVAPHDELKTFINSKVEIEHIFPSNPPAAMLFDKPGERERWTKRLGNLTLLEKSINASIQNNAFTQKQAAYAQSAWMLTKALSQTAEVGANTAIARVARRLQGPLADQKAWDSVAIERRQALMRDLAFELWDMPVVPANKEGTAA